MTDQAHPDPIEDPEGYAAYQAEHEDDEATREANAQRVAAEENKQADRAERARRQHAANVAAEHPPAEESRRAWPSETAEAVERRVERSRGS